jgi:CRP-like cAMP-binding protein
VFLASFLGDTRNIGWAMRRIAQRMKDLTLDAGEVLYRAGEPSHYHYFVVTGEMKLTKAGGSEWVLGDRSLIGTLDATLERPRTRTAVATKPTHLLQLGAEDWAELLEDSFDFARRAVTGLASRVHALRLRPPPLGGFDEPTAEAPRARGAVNLVDRICLLRGVPAFSRAGIQTLASLAELGTLVHARKGETLFARGAMKGRFVVVESGEVEATRPELTGRFGRGALVCGVGALGDLGAYEVRASADVRALEVSLEDYFDVMEEHFGLARSALMAISEEREMLIDRAPPAIP